MQKLIDAAQFAALAPTYDPGYLTAAQVSTAELQARMDVAGKHRLLRELLGSTPQGSLLDIGCGMGGFLLAGRELGLDVYGIEPSESHSKAAVDIFGLDVSCSYFDSTALDRTYDFVVLSHVIEHILEPRPFLVDVMKALRPGGRLIVVTPNCDSLSARVCMRWWSMYKPIDHVTLFSKRAVSECVPPGVTIERLRTSEWPGEFAAHIASALKTALRPRLSNAGGAPPEGSTRQATLGTFMKACLALASFPFYALGALLDRQSCLYAVIGKSIRE